MSDYKTAFFEKYAAAAMEEQRRYGIPASVTLAQMAVESGYGESSLAKQDNNYFGIKASKDWINSGKPWSHHHDDHYNDKFCTSDSMRRQTIFIGLRVLRKGAMPLTPVMWPPLKESSGNTDWRSMTRWL